MSRYMHVDPTTQRDHYEACEDQRRLFRVLDVSRSFQLRVCDIQIYTRHSGDNPFLQVPLRLQAVDFQSLCIQEAPTTRLDCMLKRCEENLRGHFWDGIVRSAPHSGIHYSKVEASWIISHWSLALVCSAFDYVRVLVSLERSAR